ncbi:MAG: Hsp20/alpha crystallin family protein [Burkholderiales bacterium]|nr:Hsp20/alpha crystallin family protein [Burkholderiales bacterium]
MTRSFDRLFDDNFFDRFFAPSTREGSLLRSPALDVSESDRFYTVKLDLPGITKEDVKITIEGNRVNVEAQTSKKEEKKEGDRVVYTERSSASYARSFMLPSELDQAESEAKMENGVLTLTLPKKRSAAAAQISVK